MKTIIEDRELSLWQNMKPEVLDTEIGIYHDLIHECYCHAGFWLIMNYPDEYVLAIEHAERMQDKIQVMDSILHHSDLRTKQLSLW